MPEGDTIHKTAANLRRALAGRPVTRVELARAPRRAPTPAPGTAVEAVEARGKHCLIRFADGRVLRTHMGMSGSWHLYRAGERWRRSPGAARAVVEVPGWVAVCFAAPEVELLEPAAATARGDGTAHLGPDLVEADPDLDEVLRRIDRRHPAGALLADVLLDQRVAAGIGNVYKSEVCFACRVHPAAPIGSVDEASRRALFETAARFLRANLGGHRRVTWQGGLAVYGRAGRPCPRCGTAVRVAHLGARPRVTYWCERCQAPGALT